MCGIFVYFSKKKLTYEKTKEILKKYEEIKVRGQEQSKIIVLDNIIIGFHRLAINELSDEGMQPFEHNNTYTVINGEIYDFKEIAKRNNIKITNNFDCSIIPVLYSKSLKSLKEINLTSEYAFVIYDKPQNKLIAGRDIMGVRPLFYEITDEFVCFSSLLKGTCNGSVFPPSCFMTVDLTTLKHTINYFYPNGEVFKLGIMKKPQTTMTYEQICKNINKLLNDRVKLMLLSDRQYCCLLSGGLDSSLISYLVAKNTKQKINTYTIGFEGGTDIPYANMMAKYLNSNHTTVHIETEMALKSIEDVIYAIESYDITTVRASTMQYHLCMYISKNSNNKVLFVGEGSDELFQGYGMMKNAPSTQHAFKETLNLLQEIHLYDGLRTDRTAGHFNLEVRVPFLDPQLISYVLTLDPELLRPNNTKNATKLYPSQSMQDKFKNMEKTLLRDSFVGEIPDTILYRPKEAFSDAVSSTTKSWYQIIQEYVDTIITTEEFETNKSKYEHNPPQTKEAYYYRKLFDKYYTNPKVIPHMWLHKWSNTNDPSARTL